MTLKEYNKKRDFKKSPEPKGKKSKSNKNRFVIQYHQARTNHYDLRLEYNNVLLSWAVPKGLSDNPKHKRLAVSVEDHPVEYINFEGEIPKGQYGAGSVEIFDNGTYVQLNDFKKGLTQGKLKFCLNGKKLNGVWTLVKKDDKNWFVIKSNDEYALKSKSNKNPFDSANVQLAKLSDKIPSGKDWLFEIKYDGYRIVAYVQNGKAKLVTRNNQDYTTKFKEIAQEIEKLVGENSAVFDGEVVVFDSEGRSDFSLLQNSIKTGKNNFFYVIFDILAQNGQDLRDFSLIFRKKALSKLLKNSPECIIFSEYVIGKGEECFNFAKEHNMEGVVAKNVKSKYAGERNQDWLKIKCRKRQEFVICGYLTSEKNTKLSSLVLGYYADKKLVYAGKVGTGFNNQTRQSLNQMFQKLKTTKKLLSNAPTNTIFVKPKLVAEIQFAEFTQDLLLRQPSFVGLREDKNPTDVVMEESDE